MRFLYIPKNKLQSQCVETAISVRVILRNRLVQLYSIKYRYSRGNGIKYQFFIGGPFVLLMSRCVDVPWILERNHSKNYHQNVPPRFVVQFSQLYPSIIFTSTYKFLSYNASSYISNLLRPLRLRKISYGNWMKEDIL